MPAKKSQPFVSSKDVRAKSISAVHESREENGQYHLPANQLMTPVHDIQPGPVVESGVQVIRAIPNIINQLPNRYELERLKIPT